VDYENVPRIDLSDLDERYRAIVFVGAAQKPPRAASNRDTAHRFRRVEFQKIARSGKNAVDFHIAFHLGRIFETAKNTHCFIVSRDKGFDALVEFLNSGSMPCQRIDGFEQLHESQNVTEEAVICQRCKRPSTLELHGGRWCSRCGRYASPPDPNLLPSNQPGYIESRGRLDRVSPGIALVCAWCHQARDMSGGLYDDGEWMCGVCISGYVD
jgi:hypothetical protein